MIFNLKHTIIIQSIILLVISACNTQNYFDVEKNNPSQYIGDLRDVVRTGGQRTKDPKLFILNVRGKQAVFEITSTNATILSNIKSSSISNLSITKNHKGNFDTKYSTIIIMTLKRNAFKSLKVELREILK